MKVYQVFICWPDDEPHNIGLYISLERAEEEVAKEKALPYNDVAEFHIEEEWVHE